LEENLPCITKNIKHLKGERTMVDDFYDDDERQDYEKAYLDTLATYAPNMEEEEFNDLIETVHSHFNVRHSNNGKADALKNAERTQAFIDSNKGMDPAVRGLRDHIAKEKGKAAANRWIREKSAKSGDTLVGSRWPNTEEG
jgi:hypothetical protein